MGTKKLILVPMGTKVPKWGPTWEQWDIQSCLEGVFRANMFDPIAYLFIYRINQSIHPSGVDLTASTLP